MDTLHERVHELSSQHIKTINSLADKYGIYADSFPDIIKDFYFTLNLNHCFKSNLIRLCFLVQTLVNSLKRNCCIKRKLKRNFG